MKKHKSKAPAEHTQKVAEKKTMSKIGSILEGLKSKRPSIMDMEEWDSMEPPTPTYGGPALEEELRRLRKNKQPSPYL